MSEMTIESDPEIRNTQDIAASFAELLVDAAAKSGSELEVCFIPGELSSSGDGAVSTMLSSTSGSIDLIEDTRGDVWLVQWVLGQEAGRVRRVELDDNLDDLIGFCTGLV